MHRLVHIAGLAVLMAACGEKPTDPPIKAPENLQVSVSVGDEINGIRKVDVNATASNANYFTIEFEVDGDYVEVENDYGNASYTYSESGTYAVRSRAHTTFDVYSEQIDSFTVVLAADTLPPPPDGIPATGYSTPLSYPGYTLVWNDEFDGTSLSGDWTHEIGRGNNGWGNNELQYYRPENTEVRDGYLIIKAKQETYNGSPYTSSRIITKDAQEFQYGRIDIRAALPYGQGLWPALWMLGANYPTAGWPFCGEIDIMEMVGGNRANEGDDFVHGTVHWDNNGQYASYGCNNKLNQGVFANEFHVFSLVWTANRLEWYRDDIKYCEINTNGASMDEFRQPYFFIFNVAVGGNWPGSPDASTEFPQQMVVDYVRVFQ